MTTHSYIATGHSLKAIKETCAAFEAAGCDTDNVRFGVGWQEFLAGVPDGATVVVYSVDFFPSLMELLSTLAQLQERGILLKSLQEPWLAEPVSSTTEFLVRLRELASTLHATQTKRGLEQAQKEGKRLGRPRKIVAG